MASRCVFANLVMLAEWRAHSSRIGRSLSWNWEKNSTESPSIPGDFPRFIFLSADFNSLRVKGASNFLIEAGESFLSSLLSRMFCASSQISSACFAYRFL